MSKFNMRLTNVNCKDSIGWLSQNSEVSFKNLKLNKYLIQAYKILYNLTKRNNV